MTASVTDESLADYYDVVIHSKFQTSTVGDNSEHQF